MTKTPIDLQDLRKRIYIKAKAEPAWRFWGLYVHVCKAETLHAAYAMAKQNNGAPGSDGVTFEAIEAGGVEGFLQCIRDELVAGTYQPRPNRRQEIPKGDGRVRVLGIPCIRDRVVQGALKLILEPIFEADFQDGSYGYRPKRTAHQAVQRVAEAIVSNKTYVIDVDLASYFDTVRHDLLLGKVAERVSDEQVLGLLKRILKASGKRGVPQGGVMTPRTQKVTSSLTGRWRLIGSKPGLTCDANGNIYMTYGAIDRFADGRTSQRCPWVARARAQRPGGVCVYVASIRPLAPSSVPLPAGSAVAARAGGAAGARGPGDLQAAAASGESPSPAGRRRWHDPQRDGGAGLGRLSGRGGPWRLGMARSRSSSSNTLSTACSDPSWSRSMRSWCPNSAASSAPPPR